MKRYVIEREIPGAGDLSEAELAAIAGKSNDVVESLGVPYRWITSYVAGDKIYCVHEAEDEDAIREHARRGGFPANSVSVIANEFGPHTARVGAVPLSRDVAGAALPRQHRDTLDVVGQREGVEHPQVFHPVAVRQIQTDIASE